MIEDEVNDLLALGKSTGDKKLEPSDLLATNGPAKFPKAQQGCHQSDKAKHLHKITQNDMHAHGPFRKTAAFLKVFAPQTSTFAFGT